MPVDVRRNGREVSKAEQSARTRRRILAAAAIEFRNNGLSGARVTAIAKRAKINVQALYHHFGSKDKLYTAVLNDVFTREWQDSTSEKLASLPLDEALVYLWRFMFADFGSNRTYIALLSDENTYKARHLKTLPHVNQYYHRVIEEVEAIVARGQAMSMFRDDIDASLLYAMISGAQATYINNVFTLSGVLGRDLATAETKQKWERFLLDFVVHGLRRR